MSAKPVSVVPWAQRGRHSKPLALKIDHGSERLALDLWEPKESIEGTYLRRMMIPVWHVEELIRA